MKEISKKTANFIRRILEDRAEWIESRESISIDDEIILEGILEVEIEYKNISLDPTLTDIERLLTFKGSFIDEKGKEFQILEKWNA